MQPKFAIDRHEGQYLSHQLARKETLHVGRTRIADGNAPRRQLCAH